MNMNESSYGLKLDIDAVNVATSVPNVVALKADSNRVFINVAGIWFDDLAAGVAASVTVRAALDGGNFDILTLSQGQPSAYLTLATHGRLIQENILIGAANGANPPANLSFVSGRLTTESLL